VSTPVDTNSIVIDKEAVESVVKNFNGVCYGMLKGDTKTVYDKYLSISVQNNQSYDDFVKDYDSNKETYNKLFSGAILKGVATEDKLASAIVVWGTGESSVIEFIKENNTWKINFLREPAKVFNQGATVK
jgi:hypothetical protein